MTTPDSFQALSAVEGVKAVLFFSSTGERIFEHPATAGETASPTGHWSGLLECVRPLREAELVCAKAVLYARSSPIGTLVVVTGLVAPSALIRLNCDIVFQELNSPQSAKGIFSRLKHRAGRLGGLLQLPDLYENRD